MPSLVAIDCTGQTCSVALLHGGQVIERRSPPGERQSERLLVWLEQVLAQAGLPGTAVDGLAVAIGPGAFTGVRLALAAVQGLALAWDRPVVPVSSLAALAWMSLMPQAADADPAGKAAADDGAGGSDNPAGTSTAGADAGLPLLTTLDARMDEVYAGWFAPLRPGTWPQPLAPEAVLAPEALGLPRSGSAPAANGYVAIGSGMQMYGERISRQLGRPRRVIAIHEPSAAAVVGLAALAWPQAARPGHQLQPAYLRNKVALTTAERQRQR